MFESGDRVWSYCMQKWGIVKDISMKRKQYPILVFYDDGDIMTYTKDGRELEEFKAPDLFKSEMAIVEKK